MYELFISPGCNFFGLGGDRFFDREPDYKGQIAFFDMEVLEALEDELGLAALRTELTRRNVFTRGADLNALIGVESEVQDVRFAGSEECRCCFWLIEASATAASRPCSTEEEPPVRILTDGVLRRRPDGEKVAGGEAR